MHRFRENSPFSLGQSPEKPPSEEELKQIIERSEEAGDFDTAARTSSALADKLAYEERYEEAVGFYDRAASSLHQLPGREGDWAEALYKGVQMRSKAGEEGEKLEQLIKERMKNIAGLLESVKERIAKGKETFVVGLRQTAQKMENYQNSLEALKDGEASSAFAESKEEL